MPAPVIDKGPFLLETTPLISRKLTSNCAMSNPPNSEWLHYALRGHGSVRLLMSGIPNLHLLNLAADYFIYISFDRLSS